MFETEATLEDGETDDMEESLPNAFDKVSKKVTTEVKVGDNRCTAGESLSGAEKPEKFFHDSYFSFERYAPIAENVSDEGTADSSHDDNQGCDENDGRGGEDVCNSSSLQGPVGVEVEVNLAHQYSEPVISLEEKTFAPLRNCVSPSGSLDENRNLGEIHASNNDHEAYNPGRESPPSSQGSMSSASYLDANEQSVTRNTEAFRKSLQYNCLPKEQYDILLGYIKDKHSIGRLRSFLHCDLRSYLLSSGINDENANNLVKVVENQDNSVLLPLLARVLMATYFRECENTENLSASVNLEATGSGESSFSHHNGTESRLEAVDQVSLQPPFRKEMFTTASVSSQEIVGNLGLVDESVTKAILNKESNLEKPEETNVWDRLSTSTSSLGFSEKEEREIRNTWEAAYDKIASDGLKTREKIVQAGKVLFPAVFTPKEVMECSVGGKNGFKPFSETKIRLISGTICWLLKNPVKTDRTISGFTIFFTQRDDRLSDTYNDSLKVKVYSEFAYRLRKDFKKQQISKGKKRKKKDAKAGAVKKCKRKSVS